MNYNKVMIGGRITQDPDVRYTQKGTAVSELRMAVNRSRKGDNGEKIEEVTFVDVTVWGRTAELAGQYLSKGRSVFIEGRLELDQWEDKETGKKRQKLKVVGEVMQFIGGQEGGKKEAAPGATYQKRAEQADSSLSDADDIPF